MAKLMDEKVLQAYFLEKENYRKYEVEINGKKEKITSVVRGADFPDLECMIAGKNIPCEVEWLSSRFDEHLTHDNYPDFKRRNGFLLVYAIDKPQNHQQIIIDEKDCKKWYTKSAPKIFDDAVAPFKMESKNLRKNAKLWILYINDSVAANFQTGKNAETWGWPKSVPKSTIKKLKDVKKDDIIVFFGPTLNTGKNAQRWDGKPNEGGPIFARMKGKFPEYNDYIRKENYEIREIVVCKIIKEYWDETNESNKKYCVIWKDENISNKKYPHRVKFQIRFTLNNVKLKKLNDSTNDFLRTRMQGVAIGQMSDENLIELIRKS